MTTNLYTYLAILACPFALSISSCDNNGTKAAERQESVDTIAINTPPQNIEYSSQLYYNNLDNCNAGQTGCTFIRMYYPVIENGPSQASIDTLSNKILSLLQVTETKNIQPDSIGNEFIRSYKDFIKSQGKDFKASAGWNIDKKITINYSSPNFVCLTYKEESYTGGAHGNTVTSYYNYSLLTNQALKLADLVSPEKMDSLILIGEQTFRLTKNIPSDKKLTSTGFFVFAPQDSLIGKFFLNDNFTLGENGLVFYYNNYEIAPYASGASKIVIPYSKIKGFAVKGGLLAEKMEEK